MPPFTYQSFEEIEAKEWASNTVKHILTEVTPVSFEAVHKEEYIVEEHDKSHLRRSLSFLETDLFGTQERENPKASRRSQSTILHPTTEKPQLIQPTFPCRLRNNSNVEKTTFNLFNTRNKSSKEQLGYTIWKNKIAEYSIHPPVRINFYRK